MKQFPFVQGVKVGYKCLSYLSALFTVFFILPSVFFKKAIIFPWIGMFPISVLFTGTYFTILDVITEVYGYYQARKVLFATLFSYICYAIVTEIIINVPNPAKLTVGWGGFQDPNAYVYIFGNLYLFTLAVLICGFFGNTFSIIVLSKWKILTQGRYFWFRSIISASIAAAFYSIVSMLIVTLPFLHRLNFEILKFILISFSVKMLTLIIFSYPSAILANILKKVEGIDTYDQQISYNPFAIKSSE